MLFFAATTEQGKRDVKDSTMLQDPFEKVACKDEDEICVSQH